MEKEKFLMEAEIIYDSLMWDIETQLIQIEKYGEVEESLENIEFNMKDILWDYFIEYMLSEKEKWKMDELYRY